MGNGSHEAMSQLVEASQELVVDAATVPVFSKGVGAELMKWYAGKDGKMEAYIPDTQENRKRLGKMTEQVRKLLEELHEMKKSIPPAVPQE